MYDLEGLEERKLFALYHDYVDSVQDKIRNLVKVRSDQMSDLIDLNFKLETDLSNMRKNMINNWKDNKIK